MQLFINNWSTTLTADAAAVDTALQVPPALAAELGAIGADDHALLTLAEADATGLETAWEVVRVTGVDAGLGVVTVTRAQEGTAARFWAIGSPISARLTQGSLDALRARANHTGTQPTSTVTGLDAALAARSQLAGIPRRFVADSGAITPADAGMMIVSTSATPITLTIGAEVTAAWAAGDLLPMVHVFQAGAGAVTVAGDGFSISVHATDTAVLEGEGAAATAMWRAADTWSLFGRLVAA